MYVNANHTKSSLGLSKDTGPILSSVYRQDTLMPKPCAYLADASIEPLLLVPPPNS